jgi:hypothetical protein
MDEDQPVFHQFADFEDVACLFFDADQDGDQDLFIGAGGNESRPGSRELQHRLYLNDGKGHFSIDPQAFAENNMNISVAISYDYDGDGDADLFVGGRSVPLNYGVTPVSYIYQNDGKGHFTDVTKKLNPQIQHIGMVTGAVWTDVTGDGKKELVITGEWMTTRIFSFTGGKMEEVKETGLENLYGLWQTVVSADVNGDGRNDLVIGNIGENFYLHPNKQQPVKLWVNDFDRNGTPECFLTYTVNKKDMPVFLKREVTEQYPALKKQNLKHSEYAAKTITDLFGKEEVDDAQSYLFNFCSSIIALNQGNGRFKLKILPAPVQFSSVNAIAFVDVNGDSRKDMVTGGNLFGFPPQFGRLDGSYGNVLFNDGNGNFTNISPAHSGLSVTGEVKDIKVLLVGNDTYLLFARNNERSLLYKLKH